MEVSVLGWGPVLMLVSLVWDLSSACSCYPQHPQTQFCNADFVIKAKVKADEVIYKKQQLPNGSVERFPFEHKYKLHISKVLKDSPAFLNVTDHFLYTAADSATCGVTLEEHSKYVIAGSVNGGRLTLNLCQFHKDWSTLPIRMRKGFVFRYEKNCECKINVNLGHHGKKSEDENLCEWLWHNDPDKCTGDHAMCQRNSNGRCMWTKPKLWKNCMKKTQEKAWSEA